MAVTIAAAMVVASCAEEKKEIVAAVTDHETTPTMKTSDVSTFISDSGYTRYHITAPLWVMYEEAKDPHWEFPEGLLLEQYDDNFKREAVVRCSTATFYSQRKLWKLDGKVMMVNVERDSFLTEQIFWDQQKRRVYSDSFIHVVKSDRVIEGYGFDSNENLTDYIVHNPQIIFPEGDMAHGAGNESVNTDSTSTDSTVTPRRRRPSRERRTDSIRTSPTPELRERLQPAPADLPGKRNRRLTPIEAARQQL